MEKWPYEDIVDLPRHVSRTRPQMSMEARAAQFAPFAALTGYGDAVAETARLTEEEIELSDSAAEELDRKIRGAMTGGRAVTIKYFVRDERKAGGEYGSATGRIRKAVQGELLLEDGCRIRAADIADISIY